MINSLWSLCQACPAAVPLDKRHLDHRGRYRWHEYQDVPSKVIVQNPPQPSGSLDPLVVCSNANVSEDLSDDCIDSNYAAHLFMEPNGQPLDTTSCEQLQVLRRSRSEGPSPAHGPAHRSEPGLMAAWVGRRRHVTEGRISHWMPTVAAAAGGGEDKPIQDLQQRSFATSEYRLQFAWPPGSNSATPRMHATPSHEAQHHPDLEKDVKSATAYEDSDIRPQEEKHHEDTTDSDGKPRRRRYKTEYRKKFRPFSLYHYVDGKFLKPGRSSSETVPDATSAEKARWYQEVVELRKKAGEYKFRGWGGELLPEHMAALYGQQFDIWEQVSRRSSLSALALAAASPRPSLKPAEKETPKQKKGSPKKLPSVPGHAQSVNAPRKDTTKKPVDEPDRHNKRAINQRSISAEGKLPRTRSSGKSKSPAHQASVTLAVRPSLGAIFHPVTPSRSVSAGPEGRAKKSLPVNGQQAKIKKDVPSKPQVTIKTENEEDVTDGSKDTKTESEQKSGVDVPALDIALIRSPPEPTRVKSPEQIVVRSPDSVNWTVPLETNKTFTVTQNIREGDTSRPHSELKITMMVRPAASTASATTAATATAAAKGSSEAASSAAQGPGTSTAGSGDTTKVQDPEESPVATEVENNVKDPDPAIQTDPQQTSDTKQGSQSLEASELNETGDMNTDPKDDFKLDPKTDPEPKKAEEIQEVLPSVTQPEEPKTIAEKPEATTAEPVAPPKVEDPPAKLPSPTQESLNGHQTKVAQPEPQPVAQPAAQPLIKPVKPVPGTTLRCLEDPIFATEPVAGPKTGPKLPGPGPVLPKGPRYRVLEAPCELPNYKVLETPGVPSDVLYQPVSSSSPYKVLGATPAAQGVKASSAVPPAVTSPSTTSPSTTGRSLASDVLEKARTRFDRFWGKKE